MKKLKELGLITQTDVENAKEVEIEDFSCKEHVYSGQVQTDDRTHELSVDFTSGEMGCDCERFNYGKSICKHMVALLQEVMAEDISDLDHLLKTIKDNGRFEPKYKNVSEQYLDSGCEAVNNIFGEGIPKSTISSVFGNWNTGKSIMAHQLAGKMWKNEGKKTLYIDSEQAFVGLGGEKYQEWFRDRFNIPDFEVDYRFKNTIQKLLGFFGWKVGLNYSDGGKMDSVLKPDGGTNEVSKMFEEDNYGLLVVDSITEPIEGIMGSGSESFPGRHPIQSRLVKCLRNIAVDFNVPVFVTMHLSKGPRRYAKPSAKGGKGPGYGIKYICYLKGGKQIGDRTLQRHRAIGLPPKEQCECELKKDTGFVD